MGRCSAASSRQGKTARQKARTRRRPRRTSVRQQHHHRSAGPACRPTICACRTKKWLHRVPLQKREHRSGAGGIWVKILFDSHQNNQKQKYNLFGAIDLCSRKRISPDARGSESRVDKIFKNKKAQVLLFAVRGVRPSVRWRTERSQCRRRVQAQRHRGCTVVALPTTLVDNAKLFDEVGYLMPDER